MRYVESINNSLARLLKEDEKVLVLGEDIIDPYGGAFKVTKGLSTKYPNRVISTPISEASITGFSTGLALSGYKPILEIMFGDFIMLCADQIINGISKFSTMYGETLEICFVLRTPMGGRRGYGPTHSQTLESFFLGVPSIKIVAPSIFHDPGNILYSTVCESKQPVLFIENKLLYPQQLITVGHKGRVDEIFSSIIDITDKNYPTISLSYEKNSNPDITLITYGGMANYALDAMKSVFFKEEISVEIIIPSLFKPIPINDVIESVKKSGRVIIVEEGIKTSGWGAEFASQIGEKLFNHLKCPVQRLGAKDISIPASRPLEDLVLPQTKDIEDRIQLTIDL